MPGDRIVAVDGKPIASFEELQVVVRDSPGVPLTFTIERAGQSLDLPRDAAARPRSPTASARCTASG